MPALHDPPGAGCDEGDPTKEQNAAAARGGSGGTERGNEGSRGERARAAPDPSA
jgi:hypothetical protein